MLIDNAGYFAILIMKKIFLRIPGAVQSLIKRSEARLD